MGYRFCTFAVKILKFNDFWDGSKKKEKTVNIILITTKKLLT